MNINYKILPKIVYVYRIYLKWQIYYQQFYRNKTTILNEIFLACGILKYNTSAFQIPIQKTFSIIFPGNFFYYFSKNFFYLFSGKLFLLFFRSWRLDYARERGCLASNTKLLTPDFSRPESRSRPGTAELADSNPSIQIRTSNTKLLTLNRGSYVGWYDSLYHTNGPCQPFILLRCLYIQDIFSELIMTEALGLHCLIFTKPL